MSFGYADADRHDQLQFFLYGAERDVQRVSDFLVAVSVQTAEDENLLLARAELTEAHVQALQHLFGVGGVFGAAGGGGDAVHNVRRHILDHGSRVDLARTQMIQRQIARGLKHKRFEVIDGPLAQGAGDAQVGFLQQVFSGAVIVDHALQRTQQGRALGKEDMIEARLTHGRT